VIWKGDECVGKRGRGGCFIVDAFRKKKASGGAVETEGPDAGGVDVSKQERRERPP